MDGKDLRETKTPEMTKDKIDTLGIICSFNEYLLSNHYALLGSVLDTRSQSNTKRRLGSWIMLLTHQYYLAAVLGALSPRTLGSPGMGESSPSDPRTGVSHRRQSTSSPREEGSKETVKGL